ncbi:hypothetical protein HanOQP8_Chr17g0658321 [Helianthus annuus]|nr:hypothetical protein HanIR_Chr00c07g0906211 [Helianthus annuus]KAJ0636121.1 hypothetical protein HanOQP8_Chr17g0658321 [Helianthus annuus]
MHRSSSAAKVSGDDPLPQNHRATSDETSDELPTYNPQSYIAIKEQNQIRSAEAAIHLIPCLLVICAIILWFFSDSGNSSTHPSLNSFSSSNC